jgi:hypothetical protein
VVVLVALVVTDVEVADGCGVALVATGVLPVLALLEVEAGEGLACEAAAALVVVLVAPG